MADLPSVTDGPEITQLDMLRAMMAYIWPQDNALIRKRVCISLGLLVGAKTLNVGVPFIFKEAVDNLGALSMATVPEAALAVTSSLIIGCKLARCAKSNASSTHNVRIHCYRWHRSGWGRRFQRTT